MSGSSHIVNLRGYSSYIEEQKDGSSHIEEPKNRYSTRRAKFHTELKLFTQRNYSSHRRSVPREEKSF